MLHEHTHIRCEGGRRDEAAHVLPLYNGLLGDAPQAQLLVEAASEEKAVVRRMK